MFDNDTELVVSIFRRAFQMVRSVGGVFQEYCQKLQIRILRRRANYSRTWVWLNQIRKVRWVGGRRRL